MQKSTLYCMRNLIHEFYTLVLLSTIRQFMSYTFPQKKFMSKQISFTFFENPFNLHSFKRDKSKYKASRAGGGESSNHTTSSTKPLAYRANKWATELALRRIQEKDT